MTRRVCIPKPTLRRGARPQTVAFGSIARTVDVRGWYRADDSNSIHSGTALAQSDGVFRELRTV